MKRALVLALSPLLLTAGGCGYNQIQQYDEAAQQAKQQISVQLQRRADLVPNLVNTVKGYAQHEEAVFTQVAQARAGLAGAIQTQDPAQMAAANNTLTGALGRLIAISEAYPQLKADQGFLRLQDELTGTENRIATVEERLQSGGSDLQHLHPDIPAGDDGESDGGEAKHLFRGGGGNRGAADG